MTTAAPVIDEIITALEAQGLEVDQYYPELGHGQQELPIRHAGVLAAADRQVLYRETVRNVAYQHGLYASLAPKPFPDQAGNGAHIHFSLWDPDGQDQPDGGSGRSLRDSRLGYQFIAGVLEHLPALLALTCPSYNSYRRLQPHFWSSAYTAWGPDNREGAIRLPSQVLGARAAAANAELKASDSSSNPYLALGGLLAAGLDGVRRRLEPPEPVLVDPGDLGDAERQRLGIRRYPANLREALDNLEKDPVLIDALGPLLASAFLAVKRLEWQSFSQADEDFEIRHHFWVSSKVAMPAEDDFLKDMNEPFLQDLRSLVSIDCGTENKAGVDQAGAWVARRCAEWGWEVVRLPQSEYGDLWIARLRGSGKGKVLLVGHLDTVYPKGTAAARPMHVEGEKLLGPGVCDMKGGLLVGMYAMRALQQAGSTGFEAITFFFNSEEEVGSPVSRPEYAPLAQEVDAALVLEAGRANGNIVSARKGSGTFRLHVNGHSAHAGVEPEKGLMRGRAGPAHPGTCSG